MIKPDKPALSGIAYLGIAVGLAAALTMALAPFQKASARDNTQAPAINL
ncbi:MAG: hypothetical protein JSS86_21815, partial [Cyanobacteria bacterium SZAS LIN-2]|nr:hypothetical protein [Cyanobacteria bacterium SZAS LIN-2]